MRLLWLVAAVLVSHGVARAQTLTLATYNVENYGSVDRMTADGFRTDYPKPEAEKAALRMVIRALGADVLALQEIGSAAALEELRLDLRSEGMDYPASVFLEAADRDRHVALLSRRPFRQVRRHADLAFAYLGGEERVKRGLLEAVVAAPPGELTIFVVHLKSRLTARADDPAAAIRRAAEAAAVRACIRARFPDPASGRFVVLGDCNDGARSPALRRLAYAGATLVAWRLPAVDGRGETWTEFYRRGESYAVLDHILVSPALRTAVRGGAARVYDGPGVETASDHRPLLAVLDFGAASARGGPAPGQGAATVTGTVNWPPLP
jgi:endonuclease/exonuclease/phosphatase family metal-dependent hydrolase